MEDEAKRQKDKELKKKKMMEKQKNALLKQKEKNKSNKNQANNFYSYFNDLGQFDKSGSMTKNSNKNNYFGLPTKRKIKDEETYDIENEKDTDKMYFLVAYIPIIIFWLLDSYYLLQERLYRELYQKICSRNLVCE